MLEKLSLSLARKLYELYQGETIAASKINNSAIKILLEENVLQQKRQGRTKVSYYVTDKAYFELILSRLYGIDNLEYYISVLESEEMDRAELVIAARDSKIARVRSFKGFLINSYESIQAELNGKPYSILPQDGTFSFIYDFEKLFIPEDIVIVGVENPENFRMIRSQRHLFSGIKTLFLSRYPQSQHGDVRQWLSSIPNRYLHFGDFDPAGISIFINEYHRYLGSRSSFFIPDEIEQLLLHYGLRERFDRQSFSFEMEIINDMSELKELCNIIIRLSVGMDQEALIKI